MHHSIRTIPDRHLIGKRIHTSLAENRTFELWSSFKPRLKEIPNRLGSDFYSVQHFGHNYELKSFTPDTFFDKWAAVEVEAQTPVPSGMEDYTLPGGQYAVFVHKGTPDMFPKTAAYIFGEWLPNSKYELDNRPHFEIMAPGYNPASADSEEEIWVPVRERV